MRYMLALIVLGTGMVFSTSAARAADTFDYWDRHPQLAPMATPAHVVTPTARVGSSVAIAGQRTRPATGSTSTENVPLDPGRSH